MSDATQHHAMLSMVTFKTLINNALHDAMGALVAFMEEQFRIGGDDVDFATVDKASLHKKFDAIAREAAAACTKVAQGLVVPEKVDGKNVIVLDMWELPIVNLGVLLVGEVMKEGTVTEMSKLLVRMSKDRITDAMMAALLSKLTAATKHGIDTASEEEIKEFLKRVQEKANDTP